MNFKNLAMIAATGAILAACSNDDSLSTPKEEFYGNAYAKIEINLPTVSGTRAASLLGYENGESNEYAIKDGSLVLFAGANEAEATYIATGTLTVGEGTENSDGEKITTKKEGKVTFKDLNISEAQEKGKIYGLLILNNNGIALPEAGMTFATWNRTELSEDDIMGDYFTMTSAPNVTTPTSPVSLKEIDAANIKTSEEDLKNATAVPFHVQRVVAKVRMTLDEEASTDGEFAVEGSDGDKVTLSNWCVDMTNQSTFAVQQSAIPENPGSHFFAQAETGFARSFWGTDPNYNDNASVLTNAFFVASSINDLTRKFTSNNKSETYDYCLENTMNYNKQQKGQTTRVILSGTYVKKDGTTAGDLFKVGETLYTLDDLKKLDGLNTLTVEVNKVGDYYTISSLFGDAGTAVASALNVDPSTPVGYYKNGVCYYDILIRHFSDSEAGLNGAQINNADDYKVEQLGRYGVVRNNVYTVNVTGVTKIGRPNIPDPTETPDPEDPDPDPIDPDEPNDSSEVYIKCTINVLAWAQRSQNEKL